MPTATTVAANTATLTCLDCEYPLTGLANNQCPECGRAFDPAVRETMGPHTEHASGFSDYLIKGIVVQSIIFLFMTSILSDGLAEIGLITAIAHWCAIAIIAIRRIKRPTRLDCSLALSGALVFLLPTFFFAMAIPGWLRPFVPIVLRAW